MRMYCRRNSDGQHHATSVCQAAAVVAGGVVKKQGGGARAYQLRTLGTLAEDLGWVSSQPSHGGSYHP